MDNLAWSDAVCAETDGFWANEQLLKGGKTHGPIVLNNNNNKMFLETSTFLAINGIVSLLEASYELGPLSSLPLVSP